MHTGAVLKVLSLAPEEWLHKRLSLLTYTCFYLKYTVAFHVTKKIQTHTNRVTVTVQSHSKAISVKSKIKLN